MRPSPTAAIAPRVDARIAALLAAERERWSAVDADLADPIDAIRSLVLAGGKRLRPAFCFWAFVGAGGDPDDPAVVDAAAALELLHTFALFHDDVMDGSDRRRGVRTVHDAYAGAHRSGSWRGEARRFGEGVAILAGDLAFVYADRLVPAAPAAVRAVYDELRVEVNVGQYLDLLHAARPGVTVDQARRIARYKSGRYSVERPLHLGAALAGRFDDLAAALSAYGRPLGEAFQLRDDLLGAFGDGGRTGKPVGDDLRAGKPTLLLALAAERARGPAAAVLARAGDPSCSADDVAALQQVLVDTGARAEVEALVASLAADARRALASIPLASDAARDALDALVDLAVDRDA